MKIGYNPRLWRRKDRKSQEKEEPQTTVVPPSKAEGYAKDARKQLKKLTEDGPGSMTAAGELDEEGVPLPSQADLFKANVRPRQLVDIIYDSDYDTGFMDVRKSVIHDIDTEGRLLIGQTSPPILKSSMGRMVEITFVSRHYDVPGGRWVRVGYSARLLDFLPDYPVTPSVREPVILTSAPTKLKPASVRMSFRVRPPAGLDMGLFTLPDKVQLNLQDMSSGGALFQHTSSLSFQVGTKLYLKLVSGDLNLNLKARVVRSEQILSPGGTGVTVNTSVRFEDQDPDERAALSKFILEIYRFFLAERSGLL